MEYVPKYKEMINKLKENYELVGYVRKSKNHCEDNDRIRLLQTMIKRLKERHSVDRIYVSPYSKSTEIISARDMCDTSKALIEKFDNISGNTQGNSVIYTQIFTMLIIINNTFRYAKLFWNDQK